MIIIRHFKLNENYFKTWSKEMAYILGFISSDGNINNNRIEIKLQYRDIDILVKIKKCLEFSGNIRITNEQTQKTNEKRMYCRLRINSIQMVNDLKILGITSNKSLSIQLPIGIPNEYIIDFVKGYFDGDGSITSTKKKPNHKPIVKLRIFSGSKILLQQIVDSLYDYYNIKPVNVHNSKDRVFYICYSCKASTILYSLFYSNSEIHLERKFNEFATIIQERE